MSDIKLRKSTAKLPPSALRPAQLESNTKSKTKQQDRRRQPEEETVTRNLMADFNAANKYPAKLNSQLQDSQLQSQSESICATSHLSDLSQQSSILEKENRERNNDYGTQLPQSYILAMTGLQEAVKIRDADIRKLKKQLKQQVKLHEHCDEERQNCDKRQLQLEETIKELQLEIKFMKGNLQEMKMQHNETIREKTLVESELRSIKESRKSQSFNSQNQIQHVRKDLQTAMKELDRVSQENREKKSELESRKKEMTDMLLREGQERAKDKAEMEALKHQLALFSERLVIEQARAKEQSLINERQKLQSMEVELAVNRQILKEVTQQVNQPRPRSYTLLQPAYQPQTEQKAIPKLPLQSTASKYEQSAPKYDQSTAPRMQRSSSRMKFSRESQNRSDRRNLISQYRQQIRYEKQLQALNYQMQLLEKNMVSQTDPLRRQQLQRSYAKLKREIEKKQLQIRDIKTFLNDPAK